MQNDPLKILPPRRPVFLLALLAALCLLPHSPFTPSARAQLPPQKENRFLFIINTSSAMRRFTNGVRDAVQGLLQSDMQGQMLDGDTFGIWTYDDKLHTDFSMQVWSTPKQDDIMAMVNAYLDSRHYEKRPRLEKVMAALAPIVAHSRVLTLIFIFDGSETMQGTPYDKDINDLHKEFGRQMRSDHIPFVTVLAARDGKYFEYTVNVPSTVTLPHTTDMIIRPPPVTNAPPIVAVPPPKPPEPRHIELILTNPTPAKITLPPAASTPVVQIETEKPVLQPTPAPPPVQTPVIVAPIPPAPVTAIIPAPPVATPTPPPATVNNSIQSPAASPAPTPKPAPSPPPIAAVVTPAVSKPAITPASAPAIPAMSPDRPAPMAAQTVVAMPSPEDHIALLVIAFSLLTIAVVLLLFLLRRSRSNPSLISQSMDRPR